MTAIRAGCKGAFPGTFNVFNARKAVKNARNHRKLLAKLSGEDQEVYLEGSRGGRDYLQGRIALATWRERKKRTGKTKVKSKGKEFSPVKLRLRQDSVGVWEIVPFTDMK